MENSSLIEKIELVLKTNQISASKISELVGLPKNKVKSILYSNSDLFEIVDPNSKKEIWKLKDQTSLLAKKFDNIDLKDKSLYKCANDVKTFIIVDLNACFVSLGLLNKLHHSGKAKVIGFYSADLTFESVFPVEKTSRSIRQSTELSITQAAFQVERFTWKKVIIMSRTANHKSVSELMKEDDVNCVVVANSDELLKELD
jgi:hypothetical protein